MSSKHLYRILQDCIFIRTKLYQLKERKLVTLNGIYFLQFLFVITKMKKKKCYESNI